MKNISTLSLEWKMSSSIIVDILTDLGVQIDGPNTELTEQQYNMLCDELSKNVNKVFSNPTDKIIETIDKLGPLTDRMSVCERLSKINEISILLQKNNSAISWQDRIDAKKKVDFFLKSAQIQFKEEQEKSLLNVLEKYSDLQIKHTKDDKGRCNIDVIIEPYDICFEYNRKQDIWMSIQHITKDKNNEERPYPIFPNANILISLIHDNLKFVKGRYVISCFVESWPQTIGEILSNIKKNLSAISSVFENSTMRFPDGTMKVKRKVWKSHALLVDIHQESVRDFIQGVKKDRQPFYDNTPYLYGSNGTYVGPEEKYFVLTYKVLRPRQESFYSENRYTYIEKFIREQYLPQIQRERMSANLLEEINKKLSGIKLDVVTRDFDQFHAVSINASYLPLGFYSWEDYLKTIL